METISVSKGAAVKPLAFVPDPLLLGHCSSCPVLAYPGKDWIENLLLATGREVTLCFKEVNSFFFCCAVRKKIMIMLRWRCISSKRVSNDWV